MKIEQIITDIRVALDSHVGTKAYNKMAGVLYSNSACIRDTATSELYWVNYNSEWRKDDACGLNPSAAYYLTGDYEYYDPVRVYGVGYLTPKDEINVDACLDDSINPYLLHKNEYWEPQSKDSIDIRFCGCGCCFYTRRGSCEIKIKNISEFAKHNYARKRVGTRHSIPFDANAADNAYAVLIIKDQDSSHDPEQAWADIETIFGDKFNITKLDLKGRSYGYAAN